MSIAGDIVNQIIQCQFEQNVMDIFAATQGLYNIENYKTPYEVSTGMCAPNVLAINLKLDSFIPTSNIDDYITDFRKSANDFVLDVNKSYRDGSNFLSGLIGIMQDAPCVASTQSLLDALGIGSYVDLRKLPKIPTSFLDWSSPCLLRSMLDRVYTNYPFPEFSIGINLAQILHNSLGRNIIKLLSDLDKFLDCLNEYFGVDLRYIRTGAGSPEDFFSINSMLSSMHLKTDGKVDIDSLPVDDSSKESINIIVKTNQLLVNDSLNNMAKVTKSFQLSPFIFNVA